MHRDDPQVSSAQLEIRGEFALSSLFHVSKCVSFRAIKILNHTVS